MWTANRILSTLLGLLLIIVGLAVVIEMVVVALGWEPLAVGGWYDSLREITFADSRFLTTAAVAALIGLVLVILELRPRPPRVTTNAAAGTPLSIPRRSVERRVELAAAGAGVEHARSAVFGSAARWRVRVRGVARPDQRDAVIEAVRAELERLDAPPEVSVSVAFRRGPR